MEIISIFYSEFDIHTGPELVYQYPLNEVSTDQFKKISYFVIPNNNLCGKLNVLKLTDPELRMEKGYESNEERSFADDMSISFDGRERDCEEFNSSISSTQ